MPTPYAHTLSAQSRKPEYDFNDVYAVHSFLDLARCGVGGKAHRPLLHNDYGVALLSAVLPRSPFSRRELKIIAINHLIEDGLMKKNDAVAPTLASCLALADPLYWRGVTQPLPPDVQDYYACLDDNNDDDADDEDSGGVDTDCGDDEEESRLASILNVDESAVSDELVPLYGYSHLVIDVETERHCQEDAKQYGGLPDAYRPLHSFMNEAAWFFPSFAHRAVLHNSLGYVIAEMAFGPFIDISSPSTGRLKPIATRTLVDRHVVRDMGKVPALHAALATIAGVVR